MIKTIAINLITKYFGKYIKDLNKDNLEISLWNGNVSLTDLSINKDAFEDLIVGIPLKVKQGKVGNIQLSFK